MCISLNWSGQLFPAIPFKWLKKGVDQKQLPQSSFSNTFSVNDDAFLEVLWLLANSGKKDNSEVQFEHVMQVSNVGVLKSLYRCYIWWKILLKWGWGRKERGRRKPNYQRFYELVDGPYQRRTEGVFGSSSFNARIVVDPFSKWHHFFPLMYSAQ